MVQPREHHIAAEALCNVPYNPNKMAQQLVYPADSLEPPMFNLLQEATR